MTCSAFWGIAPEPGRCSASRIVGTFFLLRRAAALLAASAVVLTGCIRHVHGVQAAESAYAIPIIERLEDPPAGEPETIRKIVRHAERTLHKQYCDANGGDPCCRGPVDGAAQCARDGHRPEHKALRDAHAKHHGCVLAQFEAAGDSLPSLAKGVFARGGLYDAIVRFSNGNPVPRPDRQGDGRGMAIKLMDVPADKLLTSMAGAAPRSDEERNTQDFLLINHPVFFIPDVATYAPFLEASDSGSSLSLVLFFATHWRELFITRALTAQRVFSPLEITYHSMTPYLLGSRDEGVAVKYRADPVSCADGSPIEQTERPTDADDFLRRAMIERLAPGQSGGSVCFDFSAVVRRDDSLSIEDATNEWPATGADRVKLARLTIPPQQFDSEAQQTFCENLSFTPWHALPEHQPLGGLNRARLPVYLAISRLRHSLNRAPQPEPRGKTWPALLSSGETRTPPQSIEPLPKEKQP